MVLYQWSGETGIIIIKVFCCFCLFFVIFSSKIGTFWLKFEEEIRHSECRKWRFRASNFKKFLGGMPQDPPSLASIRATVTFQPGSAPGLYPGLIQLPYKVLSYIVTGVSLSYILCSLLPENTCMQKPCACAI